METGAGEVGFKETFETGDALSFDTKGITGVVSDGLDQFRIGGNIEADFGAANARALRRVKPYDETVDYRRTFFETYVTLQGAYEFALQYDFSDPRRPINDAVFAYRGLDRFIFSVGNFKEPFSLNQLISDSNTLFLERSLSDWPAPIR